MVDQHTLPPASSEEFTQLLGDMAQANAPRRFALCEVAHEIPDARIFAWGLADDDGAHVNGIEDFAFGRFDSAERARRFFAHSTECRLVWIDPA